MLYESLNESFYKSHFIWVIEKRWKIYLYILAFYVVFELILEFCEFCEIFEKKFHFLTTIFW